MEEMRLGRFPNKEFFWGVAFTIIPLWAKAYHQRVLDDRSLNKKPSMLENKRLNKSGV